MRSWMRTHHTHMYIYMYIGKLSAKGTRVFVSHLNHSSPLHRSIAEPEQQTRTTEEINRLWRADIYIRRLSRVRRSFLKYWGKLKRLLLRAVSAILERLRTRVLTKCDPMTLGARRSWMGLLQYIYSSSCIASACHKSQEYIARPKTNVPNVGCIIREDDEHCRYMYISDIIYFRS